MYNQILTNLQLAIKLNIFDKITMVKIKQKSINNSHIIKKYTKKEQQSNDDRRNWYRKQHFNRWNFTPIAPWINNIISDLKLDKYKLSSSSSFARTIPIEFAKLYIMLDRVDLICTVFRIKFDTSDEIINYAYLYSSPCDYFPRKSNINLTNDQLYHRYACFGPSLESADGEFRYRFNEPDRILNYIFADKKLSALWDNLCKFIKQKIQNEDLAIFTDYFYPTFDIEHQWNIKLETDIENNEYKLNFLIITWFSELITIYNRAQQNHINELFNNILFVKKSVDLAFIRRMISEYGKDIIDKFEYIVFHMTTTRFTQTPIFGQKIIPLSLSEVENPLNIRGEPWKEIYINNILNLLVVNVISPSFPILADWFYIKNTSKSLFDTKKIYESMALSEYAKRVSRKLSEAERQVPRDEPVFKKLHEHVEEDIDISRELTASNVALCVINEFIGRTIADIPHLIQSSSYSKIFSNIFANGEYFRRYMFEIIYGLFCMNSKCGVIHDDLHLNNAVNQLRFPEEKTTSENVFILYILDSKSINLTTAADIFNGVCTSKSVYESMESYKNKLQFILPHEFMHWSIIDFSRSSIHPYFINLSAFPNKSNDKLLSQRMKDKYIEDQRVQIERGYGKIIKSFDEQIDSKLKIGLIDNFDAIWKLYTAIDIYKFSKFLTLRLEQVKNDIVIDPSCGRLLKKINELAYYHLNIKLIKTLNERTPSNEIEYPNFDIIKECFTDCMVTDKSKLGAKLSDIYIYSNEMCHSLDKYDDFPEYVKDWYGMKGVDSAKKYKLNDETHQRFIQARKQLEIRQANDMNIIWTIAHRQKEKNI